MFTLSNDLFNFSKQAAASGDISFSFSKAEGESFSLINDMPDVQATVLPPPGFTIPPIIIPDTIAPNFSVTGQTLASSSDAPASLRGGTASDSVTGGNGNDELYGAGGNDIVTGGGGRDLIYGGSGVISPDDAVDTVIGGAGGDEIYGNGGNDLIIGDAGLDAGSADDAGDTLVGGLGDDTIYGNRRDDFIYGLNGNEVISGGLGNDLFVFSFNNGDDLILDFEGAGLAGGDLLAIDRGLYTTAADAAAAVQYANGFAHLSFGSFNGSITLLGIAEGTLNAGDFTIFDGLNLV